MGVRGLSTFMGANPQLLRKYRLHDCSVVVDGNNLCHKLYHDCKIDCYLGGDYNLFYLKLVHYFEAFRKCNVTSYVIFDGAYDISDRKLKTTLARAEQRLSHLKQTSKGVFGHRTLPIMAMEVFRDVLLEMKINFAHSDFEADDQIVALANKLQCTVMSQDSDFYIFNIDKGYVPFDSLDITIKMQKAEEGSEAYRYMESRIYEIDNFVSCFENLDRSVLPLFGAMLGNDFVDAETFDRFFSNVRLPKKMVSKFVLGQCHGRMIGLLAWLQEWTAEQAVHKVLQYLKTEERKRAHEAITYVMDSYNVCKNSLIIHMGLNGTMDCDAGDMMLMTVANNALPDWFCQQFRKGNYPPYFVNAMVRRRVFLLAQPEDWKQASSYKCSLSIRRVIYGILLSTDIELAALDGDVDKKIAILVVEHGQHAGIANKSHIRPLLELPKFGFLPKLENVNGLPKSKQMALLFEVLKIKNFNFHVSLPHDWALFTCTLTYCLQSFATSVLLPFLNSILLMALYVYLVSGPSKRSKNKARQDKCITDLKTVKDLLRFVMSNPENQKNCYERLSKFENEPKISHVRPPDITSLHWFAEFQTSLLFASYLNRLIGSPLQHFMPSHFLNGTFLYNAYQDIKNRSSPDLFVGEILGKGSAILALFFEIRDTVLQEAGEDVIAVCSETSVRKARKKRKTAKKTEQKNASSSSDSCCSQTRYVATCAISNKYANLDVQPE